MRYRLVTWLIRASALGIGAWEEPSIGRPREWGSVLKSVAYSILAAVVAVASAPAPATAQENLAAFVVARVCLPYASRAKTFEGAMRAARDMDFRRPAGDRAPLEDWASEVEMISRDGRWRLRIEEGTVEDDGVAAYVVTCGVSSNLVGSRELGRMARLIVGRNPLWSQTPGTAWRWERRTPRPDEYAIHIDVTEGPDRRALLAARGVYY